MLKVKVIGKEEIEKSLYGQLLLGLGKFSGLDEELSNEASKAGISSDFIYHILLYYYQFACL